MEPHNLQVASDYINNVLLARGLLLSGTPIDFAHPENEDGGADATMARVINLVNDLVLRRDVCSAVCMTVAMVTAYHNSAKPITEKTWPPRSGRCGQPNRNKRWRLYVFWQESLICANVFVGETEDEEIRTHPVPCLGGSSGAHTESERLERGGYNEGIEGTSATYEGGSSASASTMRQRRPQT